ncbi:unnamed protein product [Blepharisma stoltei]|uniref:Cysteine dioxygenase n=1 Tax=Blepharisma stoltei TaxID=1481888 RepID=A0AAU9IZ21_9CILI|nr:unnamed protein product [Blepharisma stoltei]
MQKVIAEDSFRDLFQFLIRLSSDSSSLIDLANEIELNKPPFYINETQQKLISVTAEDLGIDKASCFYPKFITYIEVFENRNLSIGIFAMSKGSAFPIHDHPHMIGITYLIFGEISLINRDIISINSSGIVTTRVLKEEVAVGPQIFYLTANSGNLHEIHAHEDSLILDIFLPSYSEDERPCTYYKEIRPNLLIRYNPNLFFRNMQYLGKTFN